MSKHSKTCTKHICLFKNMWQTCTIDSKHVQLPQNMHAQLLQSKTCPFVATHMQNMHSCYKTWQNVHVLIQSIHILGHALGQICQIVCLCTKNAHVLLQNMHFNMFCNKNMHIRALICNLCSSKKKKKKHMYNLQSNAYFDMFCTQNSAASISARKLITY